jgi:DNA-binding response OmpR family regulator
MITISPVDTQVEICVIDTGIGINEADLQLIFERFNRAGHANSESIQGAGIGLALVKELVEANSGQITLTSEVDVGSTFTVILPIADGEPQSSQTASQTTSHQLIEADLALEIDSITQPNQPIIDQQLIEPGSQLKVILIIDDNADMRELLHTQLIDDYNCLQAHNGKVGLELALQYLPDLIISDVMMPIMDGYELAQQLKKDELTHHIPLILLTAKGSLESRVKGLQMLVDDYLAKPFNGQELKLRIHNILTIRDIIRKRFGQLIRGNEPQAGIKSLGLNEVEQAFWDQVTLELEQNYTYTEYTVKAISSALGMGDRQFQRKLKTQFDLSFPELLRNHRLARSVQMLRAGHKVSQIYYNVGFSSHSYFSSCFKAKFDKTPKEFMQD